MLDSSSIASARSTMHDAVVGYTANGWRHARQQAVWRAQRNVTESRLALCLLVRGDALHASHRAIVVVPRETSLAWDIGKLWDVAT